MNRSVKAILLATFLLVSGNFNQVSAQLAVKTNFLYDATTTPNLGLELGIGKKHSMQLLYGLNPWEFDGDNGGKYFKHWMLSPEFRYWFCHRFQGSFLGIHALGGEFNAANVELPFGLYKELRDHRFEGWYAGGGITYGYQWVLSHHWNFEAAVGVGAIYAEYKKFECGECGRQTGKDNTVYVGPTKAALSLVYMF